MSARQTETVWKNMALIAATALVTGSGAYISLAHGSVDRTEVENIVNEQSPYVKDRAIIHASLNRIEVQLQELDGKADRIEIEIARLKALNEKK